MHNVLTYVVFLPEAWRSHRLKCSVYKKCPKISVAILTITHYYAILYIAAVQMKQASRCWTFPKPPYMLCMILQCVHAWDKICIHSMCKSHLRSLSSSMIMNTEAGDTERSVEFARTMKTSKEASTVLSWMIVMFTHWVRIVVPAVKVNTWFKLS